MCPTQQCLHKPPGKKCISRTYYSSVDMIRRMIYRGIDQSGVGVTKRIFSVILPSFQNDQNTGYRYRITLIFDRCHHSWAAETPDKYERDWKYLSYNFCWMKISRNGEINERGFRNPHPWMLTMCFHVILGYAIYRITITIINYNRVMFCLLKYNLVFVIIIILACAYLYGAILIYVHIKLYIIINFISLFQG